MGSHRRYAALLRWGLPLFIVAGAAAAVTIVTGGYLSAEHAAGSASKTAGGSNVSLVGGPLNLETQPAGALALLDDREIGVTPISVASVAAGPHQLRLTAANYQEWSGEILVPTGRPLFQRISLPPLPGILQLGTSLSGVRIWVDEQEAATLPGVAPIDAGERSIRAEAQGLGQWEGTISVQPNEHRSLYIVSSGSNLSLVSDDPSNGVAVMIDNQADARPQTGLNQAYVVYEALVEGGITRYMALFLTHDEDVVGPARSARHYFVNWASEYQVPLMHIGASPQGYAAIAAARIRTVDSRAFWRTSRPAPHNAYTSTAAVQSAVGTRGVSTFAGLRYPDAPSSSDSTSGGARFNYGSPAYTVGWVYDPELGAYLRSINGRPQVDADSGDPIRAANILFIWMESWRIPDDEAGRLDFRQVGKGPLLALVHGTAIEGEWSRSSLRTITEYHDTQGSPLGLNRGATWIQVVPLGTQVNLLELDVPPAGGTN